MKLKSFYKIRFSDCDSFKHLHNSNYIDYMINAREDHLKEFHNLSMTDLYEKGLSWLVNSHEIIYLRPASYNEVVCIRSALVKAADDSLLVEMVMMDEKETHVKALLATRFIHFNTQKGKRERHPDWFLELAKTLEDTNMPADYSIKERLNLLLNK